MMSSIPIKPNHSVYILLNKAHAMNNPRLSIRLEENVLDEDDDDQTDDSSDILRFQNQYRCMNCDSLKQMLYSRDDTILKLVEDRDQLKIKLTKAMNQNIELSRQMLKYQPSAIRRSTMQANNHLKLDEKVREELDFYKKRCHELEGMNQQLKHHLYSLRNVFAELGKVGEPDEEKEEEEDDYRNLPATSNGVRRNNQLNRDEPKVTVNGLAPNGEEDVSVPKPMVTTATETKDAKKPEMVVVRQQQTHDQQQSQPVLSDFDVWYNS